MRPTFLFTRSALLPVLVSFLLVAGCKKTDAPAPDLAGKVMGTYAVTMISSAGSSQPVAVTGGTVVLIRNGVLLDKVDLTFTYATASTSGSSNFSETKSITLQPSGIAITLFDGATQVGSWVNNTVTFTNYPFNNTTLSFTASR